jgi:hypothetical protein
MIRHLCIQSFPFSKIGCSSIAIANWVGTRRRVQSMVQKRRCRVSRGASFDLPESTARAVICDAKASKVRFEEFSLSREAAEG